MGNSHAAPATSSSPPSIGACLNRHRRHRHRLLHRGAAAAAPRRRRAEAAAAARAAADTTFRVTVTVEAAPRPVSMWVQLYTDRMGALERPFPFMDVVPGGAGHVLSRVFPAGERPGRVLFCEVAARRDAGVQGNTDPVAAVTATAPLPPWTLGSLVVEEARGDASTVTTVFRHAAPLTPAPSCVGYSVVLAPSDRTVASATHDSDVDERHAGDAGHEGHEGSGYEGNGESDTGSGSGSGRSDDDGSEARRRRRRLQTRSASPAFVRRRRRR